MRTPPITIENYQNLKNKNYCVYSKIYRVGIMKKSGSSFEGEAKNDYLLPQQRYQYVRPWLYFRKKSQRLPTNFHWFETLS